MLEEIYIAIKNAKQEKIDVSISRKIQIQKKVTGHAGIFCQVVPVSHSDPNVGSRNCDIEARGVAIGAGRRRQGIVNLMTNAGNTRARGRGRRR